MESLWKKAKDNHPLQPCSTRIIQQPHGLLRSTCSCFVVAATYACSVFSEQCFQ